MTDKNLLDFLLKSLDNSKQAVIFFRKSNNNTILANTQAKNIFANENGFINLQKMFDGNKFSPSLTDLVEKHLQDVETTIIYDIFVNTDSGEQKLCDLQIAYADNEKEHFFAEIFFKEDSRMTEATNQVNQSLRAEGIFHLDEKLTLIHCNHLFYEIFETDKLEAESRYENQLSNGFQEDDRAELLGDIHKNLKSKSNYKTQTKLVSSKGEEKWYSLQFHKRTLDDSGNDKILVHMENIEHKMSMEDRIDYLNTLLLGVQELTDDSLFVLNIPNKIMTSFDPKTSQNGLTQEIPHFPESVIQTGLIYPDDLEKYRTFGLSALQGHGGSEVIRLQAADGSIKHRKFIWTPLKSKSGIVEEVIGKTIDVDDLILTQSELNVLSRQFNALQELSDDVLFRVDIENKKLIRRTDKISFIGEAEVVKFPDDVLNSGAIHPEDKVIFKEFSELALSGKDGTVEVRMKELGSEEYLYRRITWIPVLSNQEKITEVVGKLVNVQAMKDLEEQAKYDELTKALNKRAMYESTSQILSRSRPDEKHALFFMDLDDFKFVNDNLGHAFGDFLLSELGRRLSDGVRYHDLIGRVGGDEFVIFLRNIPNQEMLQGKAKMLLSSISEDFSKGNIYHNINGSLGIAVYPDHGTSYEELYHHADLALYQSKRTGKNLVTMYTEDLKDK